MAPIRAGIFYGFFAALVAVADGFYFLALDPAETPEWVTAALADFHTPLALAAYLFLAILAALRVRPARLDPGVSYRSLLVRDCALAATVVAVIVGVVLLVSGALQATLFADETRAYAREAAPRIVEYVEEVRGELSEPPPPPSEAAIERRMQPPTLRDLGRSMTNFVLRAILLGATGAAVGALRGLKRPAPPKPA